MKVSEVELSTDFSQAERYKNLLVRSKRNPIEDKIKDGTADLVGKIKGHTLYLEEYSRSGWKTNSRFYAVNDQTGLIDITVDGYMERKGKSYTFKINTLDGRGGSSMKAYEFYRAIMLKMPIILMTDQQSYGGMRTWQELSRYPDIEVFGWMDGKPINVDPLDPDETHATRRERDPESMAIRDMYLVAHRKISKRGR